MLSRWPTRGRRRRSPEEDDCVTRDRELSRAGPPVRRAPASLVPFHILLPASLSPPAPAARPCQLCRHTTPATASTHTTPTNSASSATRPPNPPRHGGRTRRPPQALAPTWEARYSSADCPRTSSRTRSRSYSQGRSDPSRRCLWSTTRKENQEEWPSSLLRVRETRRWRARSTMGKSLTAGDLSKLRLSQTKSVGLGILPSPPHPHNPASSPASESRPQRRPSRSRTYPNRMVRRRRCGSATKCKSPQHRWCHPGTAYGKSVAQDG